jgi:hypothetical protein
MRGSVAAAAGDDCAPAALFQPLSSRPLSFVRFACDLCLRAAPQLHR